MNRNTLILLGAVVLLGGMAFFLMQRPGEQSLASSEGDPLLRIDSASVDRIMVKSSELDIALAKRGSEWFLEAPLSARANQNAVTSLLHDAATAKIEAAVSNKPEKHALFQVDSSGTVVKFYKQDVEHATLVIGKDGPSYSDVYARAGNSDEVCLVDAAVSRSARRQIKDWRDRVIISVPRENIKEIQYQYGDTTFTVTWQDSVWMIGKERGNDGAINSLVGSLSELQTDEFLDAPPAKSKLVATITFAGTQLRLSQAKGNTSYTVQSSGSPQFYELQSWHANSVLKRKKDLLKTPS